MSEWQPIETAPRDGSRLLLSGRGSYDPFWDTKSPMPFIVATGQWWEYSFEDFEEVGDGSYRKIEKKRGQWRANASFFQPTHWMPLPEPAAITQAEPRP